ncbi:MAG TPA: hypothetical protein VF812_14905 [Ktedonobacterales bacterium]
MDLPQRDVGPSVYWYPALGERFGDIGPLGIAERWADRDWAWR